jgi:hypothetical protein
MACLSKKWQRCRAKSEDQLSALCVGQSIELAARPDRRKWDEGRRLSDKPIGATLGLSCAPSLQPFTSVAPCLRSPLNASGHDETMRATNETPESNLTAASSVFQPPSLFAQ